MRRGDIWAVAGGWDYAGKPRPVVIVQDDSFDATDSITVCAFTSDETEAPLFRLPVEPNHRNGLIATSRPLGRQDHHRPEVQGWCADRPLGRRRYPETQSGDSGLPRGQLAQGEAGGIDH
jgi:mRNA-degrading endonuclease toxin of MazEF toxin-antitoxin module